MRIEPEQLNQLLRPIFDPTTSCKAVEEGRVKAKGLPAGPGAATGRVVFNAQDAVAWAADAARRSCWSATSRARTTSAAWTPPRASSRRRAA